MRSIPAHCVIKTTNSKIVVEENHRRFEYNNFANETVDRIQIDGCVPIAPPVCDYGISFSDKSKYWLIELKGKNILHAIRQLENTYLQLKTIMQIPCEKIIVVSSCCPIPLKVNSEKIRIKTVYGITLIVKNRNCVMD